MAFFRIYVVDTKFFNMSAEERIKALEKIEVEAKLADASGTPQEFENKFPEWLRIHINEFAAPVKPKYCDDNDEYKFMTPSTSKMEAQEEYAKFKAKMEQITADEKFPERKKWSETHHVQISISFDDEREAMNELEHHLGGKPSKKGKRKKR